MFLCCASRSDTSTCLYHLSQFFSLSLIHHPLPVFCHLYTWENSESTTFKLSHFPQLYTQFLSTSAQETGGTPVSDTVEMFLYTQAHV